MQLGLLGRELKPYIPIALVERLWHGPPFVCARYIYDNLRQVTTDTSLSRVTEWNQMPKYVPENSEPSSQPMDSCNAIDDELHDPQVLKIAEES